MLVALAGAGASAQEEGGEVTFSQWIQRGAATVRGRALQDLSSSPACLSDCNFGTSSPTSCADISALFEGTFDAALGSVGCGLDCNLAADVTALQTMLRAIVPEYECADAAGTSVAGAEAACANTCSGTHTTAAQAAAQAACVAIGNAGTAAGDDCVADSTCTWDGASSTCSATTPTTDCATTFGAAANTYGTSCPPGCTYSVNTWGKKANTYGREGDNDPGCMLPHSFLTNPTTEAALCPIGFDYDTSTTNCAWDGSFCAVHTIGAVADGTFTHSFDLPAGKTCQSCHTGYTSDGQYVCPCSLSCAV